MACLLQATSISIMTSGTVILCVIQLDIRCVCCWIGTPGRRGAVRTLSLDALPPRSLKSLAWAGAMGLVLASGFATLVVVLVVLAGIQGRIQGVSLWPNADLTGPSALDHIRGVFSTLPVIALAYVCHYNVHPCAPPRVLTALGKARLQSTKNVSWHQRL